MNILLKMAILLKKNKYLILSTILRLICISYIDDYNKYIDVVYRTPDSIFFLSYNSLILIFDILYLINILTDYLSIEKISLLRLTKNQYYYILFKKSLFGTAYNLFFQLLLILIFYNIVFIDIIFINSIAIFSLMLIYILFNKNIHENFYSVLTYVFIILIRNLFF